MTSPTLPESPFHPPIPRLFIRVVGEFRGSLNPRTSPESGKTGEDQGRFLRGRLKRPMSSAVGSAGYELLAAAVALQMPKRLTGA